MNTPRPEEQQTASDPTITGSKALIESFLHEGVTTLFGYPGGAIIPVYDALYDYRDRLRHILVRHEQGAVHAAQGIALALCFKLGGEVLRTVIVREWSELLVLGAIIFLHAAMSILIHWEIKMEEKRLSAMSDLTD